MSPTENTPTPERVAAAVRSLRAARQLKQSELAAKAGISRATLSAIESGDGSHTMGTVEAVARALGVDLAVLLEGA